MKIKKPAKGIDLSWWVESTQQLAYACALAPGDKDLANTLSKIAYAAGVIGNLSKYEKEAAEFDELKKQVDHIMKVKNRDAIK